MDARWKRFTELARAARDEPAPHVDVTHRVLAVLAERRALAQAQVARKPLLYCAAGALLAASVMALLASPAWLELNDPLADLVAGITVLDP